MMKTMKKKISMHNQKIKINTSLQTSQQIHQSERRPFLPVAFHHTSETYQHHTYSSWEHLHLYLLFYSQLLLLCAVIKSNKRRSLATCHLSSTPTYSQNLLKSHIIRPTSLLTRLLL